MVIHEEYILYQESQVYQTKRLLKENKGERKSKMTIIEKREPRSGSAKGGANKQKQIQYIHIKGTTKRREKKDEP